MQAVHVDLLVEALVLFLWVLTWSLFFFSTRQEGGAALSRSHRIFSLLTVVVFVNVGLFHWILWSGIGSMREEMTASSPAWLAIGLSMLIGGQWLMVAARRALYALSNFEVLFRISSLKVRSGPYRLLRHPMYVGLVLALVGSSLIFMNFLSLGFLVVGILPLLLLRARIERALP